MSTLTMPISMVTPADDLMDVLDRAREEMAVGDFAAARRHLEAVLDRDGSDWISRKMLAECHHRIGNPLDAAEHWNRLMSEHPSDADGPLWIDRLDPLVKAVEAVRERNPQHIQISIRNGLTRVLLGGLVAARSDGRNWKIHYARLTNAISQAAAHGLGDCVVDMTKVTFVSSYFQSLVAAWVRRLKPAGGRIVLAGTKGEIHQALLQAGLQRSVRFVGSVAAARSCFDSR